MESDVSEQSNTVGSVKSEGVKSEGVESAGAESAGAESEECDEDEQLAGTEKVGVQYFPYYRFFIVSNRRHS